MYGLYHSLANRRSVQLQPKHRTGSALACTSFCWSARWMCSIRFAGCYHFAESYCHLILLRKMITKYITKYSSKCAKCACIRNTNVRCFFQRMHAGQVGQHFNLHTNFEL